MGKVTVPEAHWDAMFAPSSCLTIITTMDAEGRTNAATFATTTRVNHGPVYIAFALNAEPPSDTCANVLATGTFVVNVVPFHEEMLRKAQIVGLPFAAGVNELERADLTALPSVVVPPVRIQECPVHFECEVAWTHSWEHRMMVCGRVVGVSADEDCYDPRGVLRWESVRPSHYCGAAYEGNFVPAYEPTFVPRGYGGPSDWRPGKTPVRGVPNVLADESISIEYGGSSWKP